MNNFALEVDPKRYGRLLARKLPTVIRAEEENDRLIAELEQLDRRVDEAGRAGVLRPPDGAYRSLRGRQLEGSTSDSRLRSLMEEHGLRQRDLLDVFGSRGIASEVVSGKRAISKAQAKKLAGLFHVPADLFL
jgi:HTH-type transcriptional regulator/antitoxin HigA